ncbi:glutaminyl-peptide cyclotransferase [Flavobacteriaceae bacterium]|nr:glutaminyl-peptide cyclotransferase [Flavobacteriaceae bacterium]
MKIFVSTLSALFLLTCSGSKNPALKIKTGIQGNKATPTTQLQLSLKTALEDYSITYSLNDKTISPDHQFSDEPLGEYILKAQVVHSDQTYETSTTITLLANTPPKLYTYELINTYPHDITAYTQGLEFDGDLLYESTGLNGKSSLRTVDFKTGKVLEKKPLDNTFFGEGLTLIQDRIVQLTWKAEKGLVYDKASLSMQKSFPYGASKEGWGLCNDGNLLYKSDGTQKIWKLNSEEYSEIGYIQVMTHKSALKNINELEWVNGKIYANTYQFEKDVVVIIDPVSGAVEGVVDFSGLKEMVKQHPELNVLNGIAYHKERQTFFVTGKNWDKLFEVKIVPKS